MPNPTIPASHLELTLLDVLSLHAPFRGPSESVPIEQINEAVAALAARVARDDAARESSQRTWLAKQFSALHVEGE
jgi:hypothetical protein